MNWLNVPHLKQSGPGWCLPACVAMVAAYWQQPVLRDDVAHWLGTRKIGTVASRVLRLTQRGFEVTYDDFGTQADLEDWLNRCCAAHSSLGERVTAEDTIRRVCSSMLTKM